MPQALKQNQLVVMNQPSGPGTAWDLFEAGYASATGKADPGVTTNPVYLSDRYGRPVLAYEELQPPGGTPSVTIGFYESKKVNFWRKERRRNCPVYLQLRAIDCGTLDNPSLWDKIYHYGYIHPGDIAEGDGPGLPFNGSLILNTVTLPSRYKLEITRMSLSSLTTSETQQLNDIALVTEALCSTCGNGYPGADQIVYITSNAAGGLTANVLVSDNGGGSFAATSADPFAADENIGKIVYNLVNFDQLRIVVARSTADAAQLPEVAFADVTFGAESTTVWTNVVSTSSSLAVNQTFTALFWPKSMPGRLYAGTSAGEIVVSTDYGQTFPNTAIGTGANQINAFDISFDKKYVVAVGNSNAILLEVNQTGGFSNRVGPSGGGNFTAVKTTNIDGLIYAGNGQSIYKSDNLGANTGGWTLLKDFGTNHVVRSIMLTNPGETGGGDSQIIRVAVDDTTPDDGEFWESVDGGATWRQITELANAGYNAAVASEIDDNYFLIVGDVVGGLGVIHKAETV